MAYKGQRYEPDDFGYPGSRGGNRDQYQQPSQRPGNDRPYHDEQPGRQSQNRGNYDDDRRRDVMNSDRGDPGRQSQNRGNYDDDRRRNMNRRGDRSYDDQGGRGDNRPRQQQQGGGGGGGGGRPGKDDIEPLVKAVREACKKRGVSGIKTMGRMFRLYDNDRSGTLRPDEFKEGLLDYGLNFTDGECQRLFRHFDTDGNGKVNYNEFLFAIRPPMSQARVDLIERAFQKLDKTGDGYITVEDLKVCYNVSFHPKYKSGEWTKKQVLEEYLNTFQVGPNAQRDDKVTKQEFMEYYAGVSSSIDKDVYFDYMMRQAWKI